MTLKPSRFFHVNVFLKDCNNGRPGTCKIVGCIFLAADQLFRMEQLTIGAGADFVDHLEEFYFWPMKN